MTKRRRGRGAAPPPRALPAQSDPRPRVASGWLIAGLFAAAVIAAAGGLALANRSITPVAQRSPQPTVSLATPPATGVEPSLGPGERAAPDFTARLLGGGSFTLSQQGGKPVLILFTASWCAPCIPEVNKMAQLQERYGARGLRQLVLSVDPGDTEEDFDGLRRRTRGSSLIWGLDQGQRALRAYQIRAVDTKVVVDREGRIVFTSIGPTAYETLQQAVVKTLP